MNLTSLMIQISDRTEYWTSSRVIEDYVDEMKWWCVILKADREREERRRAMEAELTRHFMSNVAEEPNSPPQMPPCPSYSSVSSSASQSSSITNSAAPSISSIPGIPSVNTQDVQVLQQNLKDVIHTLLHLPVLFLFLFDFPLSKRAAL